LQAKLPLANEKCSSGSFFEIDEKIQLCAGGEDGK